MRNKNVSDLSIDQILNLFEQICIKQYETYDEFDTKIYNKYFDMMMEYVDEFKSRGAQARLSLVRLFDHPNPQVRLQAALAAYKVAPEEAHRCLEAIRAEKLLDVSLAAGMALRRIDDGSSAILKD